MLFKVVHCRFLLSYWCLSFLNNIFSPCSPNLYLETKYKLFSCSVIFKILKILKLKFDRCHWNPCLRESNICYQAMQISAYWLKYLREKGKNIMPWHYLFTISKWSLLLMPDRFLADCCVAAEQYILEQKCLKKWIGSALRNTTVQLSTPYIDLECHYAQHYWQKTTVSCSSTIS